MKSIKDLEAMIKVIEAAEACPLHGREHLAVCMELGCKRVYCGACISGSCQCCNDD